MQTQTRALTTAPASVSDAFCEGESDTSPRDPAAALSSGSFPALSEATIMMVDDEPTTIDVIQVFLEDAGYGHFVGASDASTAMDVIARVRPDLLLLDLMMPEVSGLDILAAMHGDERFEHTPVIVLTSSSDASRKLGALELGATDFLAKPVDPSELVLRLRNNLAIKAYQDRLRREREKSDRLLLNILPEPVAERLKQGEPTIAE